MQLLLALLATAGIFPLLVLFSGGGKAAGGIAVITIPSTLFFALPIHLIFQRRQWTFWRYYLFAGLSFGVLLVFGISFASGVCRWKDILYMVPLFSGLGGIHASLFRFIFFWRHDA